MDNRRGRTAQTSEARGSVKEAIGKVIGDAHAEAEGAAEKRPRENDAGNDPRGKKRAAPTQDLDHARSVALPWVRSGAPHREPRFGAAPESL